MKKINRVIGIFSLLTPLIATPAYASIELPPLLSDGAVVQRDEPIPVWGSAAADSEVSVVFAGETRKVRADQDGHWQTTFSAHKAGGPYQLAVSSSGDTKKIRDIFVGDVWVCSGQSNMEWLLRNSNGAATEIASTQEPQIRHFKIPRSWAAEPAQDIAGGDWRQATPENLGDFTGVGWYFAQRIHSSIGVPIGLINSTWGGSRIEAWMSPEALNTPPEVEHKKLADLVAQGEARASQVRKTLQRWPGALVAQSDLDPVALSHADWSGTSVDEHDWLPIQAPGLWEKQIFAGLDGVVWYRRSFELGNADAAKDMVLGLGRIDDNDTAWVNGHKVGETKAYDEIRAYKIPAKYLQPGKNQIAVRIEDNGGGGGIYSSADLLYLEMADGSRQSLTGKWLVKADKVTVMIQDDMHHTATALYNKMLHPLFKIPVKGVLWYQGEANADTPQEAQAYREQFAALINDVRNRWNQPELPFYWVQLANFIAGNETPDASPWAILRDSQTAALALKNTGQAITIDIGNPDDIHPTDKKTVGERLALIALNKTYGKRKTEFRGPVFSKAKQQHNQLILSFESASKLALANKSKSAAGGNSVKGFEIADQTGTFKSVEGKIQNNTVILPIQDAKVTAIRYAWSDNPENANLINAAGLPAEPFKADF